MTRFAVSLGSNIGDSRRHMREAVDEIGALGEIVAVSGLYRTDPIGGPEQEPFLNAVVVVDTDLDARGLLDALQSIEIGHHRRRDLRWGPRTLDLDIVASAGPPIDERGLVIPHPRSADRRFVLEPLAAVWPDVAVAGGATASQALFGVTDQGVDLLEDVWP